MHRSRPEIFANSLRPADRLIFVWLYRLCPSVRQAAVVFKPETLVRWHRSGFRLYWRCKSRRRVDRPAVPADIRDLIRTISHDNPLWGAPRIHGELLKLGIDIAQSTVAKYMSRRHGPRSPGWQVFLRKRERMRRYRDIALARQSLVAGELAKVACGQACGRLAAQASFRFQVLRYSRSR